MTVSAGLRSMVVSHDGELVVVHEVLGPNTVTTSRSTFAALDESVRDAILVAVNGPEAREYSEEELVKSLADRTVTVPSDGGESSTVFIDAQGLVHTESGRVGRPISEVPAAMREAILALAQATINTGPGDGGGGPPAPSPAPSGYGSSEYHASSQTTVYATDSEGKDRIVSRVSSMMKVQTINGIAIRDPVSGFVSGAPLHRPALPAAAATPDGSSKAASTPAIPLTDAHLRKIGEAVRDAGKASEVPESLVVDEEDKELASVASIVQFVYPNTPVPRAAPIFGIDTFIQRTPFAFSRAVLASELATYLLREDNRLGRLDAPAGSLVKDAPAETLKAVLATIAKPGVTLPTARHEVLHAIHTWARVTARRAGTIPMSEYAPASPEEDLRQRRVVSTRARAFLRQQGMPAFEDGAERSDDIEAVVGALGRTTVMMACRSHDDEVLEGVLQDPVAQATLEAGLADLNGDTALHLCAKFGTTSMVKRVLEHTPVERLALVNMAGMNPIMTAARFSNSEAVKAIAQKMATMSDSLRAATLAFSTVDGDNALAFALLYASGEAVDALLDITPKGSPEAIQGDALSSGNAKPPSDPLVTACVYGSASSVSAVHSALRAALGRAPAVRDAALACAIHSSFETAAGFVPRTATMSEYLGIPTAALSCLRHPSLGALPAKITDADPLETVRLTSAGFRSLKRSMSPHVIYNGDNALSFCARIGNFKAFSDLLASIEAEAEEDDDGEEDGDEEVDEDDTDDEASEAEDDDGEEEEEDDDEDDLSEMFRFAVVSLYRGVSYNSPQVSLLQLAAVAPWHGFDSDTSRVDAVKAVAKTLLVLKTSVPFHHVLTVLAAGMSHAGVRSVEAGLALGKSAAVEVTQPLEDTAGAFQGMTNTAHHPLAAVTDLCRPDEVAVMLDALHEVALAAAAKRGEEAGAAAKSAASFVRALARSNDAHSGDEAPAQGGDDDGAVPDAILRVGEAQNGVMPIAHMCVRKPGEATKKRVTGALMLLAAAGAAANDPEDSHVVALLAHLHGSNAHNRASSALTTVGDPEAQTCASPMTALHIAKSPTKICKRDCPSVHEPVYSESGHAAVGRACFVPAGVSEPSKWCQCTPKDGDATATSALSEAESAALKEVPQSLAEAEVGVWSALGATKIAGALAFPPTVPLKAAAAKDGAVPHLSPCQLTSLGTRAVAEQVRRMDGALEMATHPRMTKRDVTAPSGTGSPLFMNIGVSGERYSEGATLVPGKGERIASRSEIESRVRSAVDAGAPGYSPLVAETARASLEELADREAVAASGGRPRRRFMEDGGVSVLVGTGNSRSIVLTETVHANDLAARATVARLSHLAATHPVTGSVPATMLGTEEEEGGRRVRDGALRSLTALDATATTQGIEGRVPLIRESETTHSGSVNTGAHGVEKVKVSDTVYVGGEAERRSRASPNEPALALYRRASGETTYAGAALDPLAPLPEEQDEELRGDETDAAEALRQTRTARMGAVRVKTETEVVSRSTSSALSPYFSPALECQPPRLYRDVVRSVHRATKMEWAADGGRSKHRAVSAMLLQAADAGSEEPLVLALQTASLVIREAESVVDLQDATELFDALRAAREEALRAGAQVQGGGGGDTPSESKPEEAIDTGDVDMDEASKSDEYLAMVFARSEQNRPMRSLEAGTPAHVVRSLFDGSGTRAVVVSEKQTGWEMSETDTGRHMLASDDQVDVATASLETRASVFASVSLIGAARGQDWSKWTVEEQKKATSTPLITLSSVPSRAPVRSLVARACGALGMRAEDVTVTLTRERDLAVDGPAPRSACDELREMIKTARPLAQLQLGRRLEKCEAALDSLPIGGRLPRAAFVPTSDDDTLLSDFLEMEPFTASFSALPPISMSFHVFDGKQGHVLGTSVSGAEDTEKVDKDAVEAEQADAGVKLSAGALEAAERRRVTRERRLAYFATRFSGSASSGVKEAWGAPGDGSGGSASLDDIAADRMWNAVPGLTEVKTGVVPPEFHEDCKEIVRKLRTKAETDDLADLQCTEVRVGAGLWTDTTQVMHVVFSKAAMESAMAATEGDLTKGEDASEVEVAGKEQAMQLVGALAEGIAAAARDPLIEVRRVLGNQGSAWEEDLADTSLSTFVSTHLVMLSDRRFVDLHSGFLRAIVDASEAGGPQLRAAAGFVLHDPDTCVKSSSDDGGAESPALQREACAPASLGPSASRDIGTISIYTGGSVVEKALGPPVKTWSGVGAQAAMSSSSGEAEQIEALVKGFRTNSVLAGAKPAFDAFAFVAEFHSRLHALAAGAGGPLKDCHAAAGCYVVLVPVDGGSADRTIVTSFPQLYRHQMFALHSTRLGESADSSDAAWHPTGELIASWFANEVGKPQHVKAGKLGMVEAEDFRDETRAPSSGEPAGRAKAQSKTGEEMEVTDLEFLDVGMAPRTPAERSVGVEIRFFNPVTSGVETARLPVPLTALFAPGDASKLGTAAGVATSALTLDVISAIAMQVTGLNDVALFVDGTHAFDGTEEGCGAFVPVPMFNGPEPKSKGDVAIRRVLSAAAAALGEPATIAFWALEVVPRGAALASPYVRNAAKARRVEDCVKDWQSVCGGSKECASRGPYPLGPLVSTSKRMATDDFSETITVVSTSKTVGQLVTDAPHVGSPPRQGRAVHFTCPAKVECEGEADATRTVRQMVSESDSVCCSLQRMKSVSGGPSRGVVRVREPRDESREVTYMLREAVVEVSLSVETTASSVDCAPGKPQRATLFAPYSASVGELLQSLQPTLAKVVAFRTITEKEDAKIVSTMLSEAALHVPRTAEEVTGANAIGAGITTKKSKLNHGAMTPLRTTLTAHTTLRWQCELRGHRERLSNPAAAWVWYEQAPNVFVRAMRLSTLAQLRTDSVKGAAEAVVGLVQSGHSETDCAGVGRLHAPGDKVWLRKTAKSVVAATVEAVNAKEVPAAGADGSSASTVEYVVREEETRASVTASVRVYEPLVGEAALQTIFRRYTVGDHVMVPFRGAYALATVTSSPITDSMARMTDLAGASLLVRRRTLPVLPDAASDEAELKLVSEAIGAEIDLEASTDEEVALEDVRPVLRAVPAEKLRPVGTGDSAEHPLVSSLRTGVPVLARPWSACGEVNRAGATGRLAYMRSFLSASYPATSVSWTGETPGSECELPAPWVIGQVERSRGGTGSAWEIPAWSAAALVSEPSGGLRKWTVLSARQVKEKGVSRTVGAALKLEAGHAGAPGSGAEWMCIQPVVVRSGADGVVKFGKQKFGKCSGVRTGSDSSCRRLSVEVQPAHVAEAVPGSSPCAVVSTTPAAAQLGVPAYVPPPVSFAAELSLVYRTRRSEAISFDADDVEEESLPSSGEKCASARGVLPYSIVARDEPRSRGDGFDVSVDIRFSKTCAIKPGEPWTLKVESPAEVVVHTMGELRRSRYGRSPNDMYIDGEEEDSEDPDVGLALFLEEELPHSVSRGASESSRKLHRGAAALLAAAGRPARNEAEVRAVAKELRSRSRASRDGRATENAVSALGELPTELVETGVEMLVRAGAKAKARARAKARSTSRARAQSRASDGGSGPTVKMSGGENGESASIFATRTPGVSGYSYSLPEAGKREKRWGTDSFNVFFGSGVSYETVGKNGQKESDAASLGQRQELFMSMGATMFGLRMSLLHGEGGMFVHPDQPNSVDLIMEVGGISLPTSFNSDIKVVEATDKAINALRPLGRLLVHLATGRGSSPGSSGATIGGATPLADVMGALAIIQSVGDSAVRAATQRQNDPSLLEALSQNKDKVAELPSCPGAHEAAMGVTNLGWKPARLWAFSRTMKEAGLLAMLRGRREDVKGTVSSSARAGVGAAVDAAAAAAGGVAGAAAQAVGSDGDAAAAATREKVKSGKQVAGDAAEQAAIGVAEGYMTEGIKAAGHALDPTLNAVLDEVPQLEFLRDSWNRMGTNVKTIFKAETVIMAGPVPVVVGIEVEGDLELHEYVHGCVKTLPTLEVATGSGLVAQDAAEDATAGKDVAVAGGTVGTVVQHGMVLEPKFSIMAVPRVAVGIPYTPIQAGIKGELTLLELGFGVGHTVRRAPAFVEFHVPASAPSIYSGHVRPDGNHVPTGGCAHTHVRIGTLSGSLSLFAGIGELELFRWKGLDTAVSSWCGGSFADHGMRLGSCCYETAGALRDAGLGAAVEDAKRKLEEAKAAAEAAAAAAAEAAAEEERLRALKELHEEMREFLKDGETVMSDIMEGFPSGAGKTLMSTTGVVRDWERSTWTTGTADAIATSKVILKAPTATSDLPGHRRPRQYVIKLEVHKDSKPLPLWLETSPDGRTTTLVHVTDGPTEHTITLDANEQWTASQLVNVRFRKSQIELVGSRMPQLVLVVSSQVVFGSMAKSDGTPPAGFELVKSEGDMYRLASMFSEKTERRIDTFPVENGDSASVRWAIAGQTPTWNRVQKCTGRHWYWAWFTTYQYVCGSGGDGSLPMTISDSSNKGLARFPHGYYYSRSGTLATSAGLITTDHDSGSTQFTLTPAENQKGPIITRSMYRITCTGTGMVLKITSYNTFYCINAGGSARTVLVMLDRT